MSSFLKKESQCTCEKNWCLSVRLIANGNDICLLSGDFYTVSKTKICLFNSN